MSSPDVYDKLETFLKAEWSDTPLVFENEEWPLDEGDPAAFVYVEIFGNFYSQELLGDPGNNLWRETGTMQLHVMVPNTTGTRIARTHAKALVSLFKEAEVDGVRFREMSIGAGEPGMPSGNYFPMTATVDWEFDENG